MNDKSETLGSCMYLVFVYSPVLALMFLPFNMRISAGILLFYAVILIAATLAAVFAPKE